MKRDGTKLQRFHISRFSFAINKGWYVQAREGRLGPFLLRSEAQVFLNRFLVEQAWKFNKKTASACQ